MAKYHRSKEKKLLAGVFGGLSELTGIKVEILRWLPFVLTLLVYILFGSNAMLVFVLAVVLLYAGYWFSAPIK